MPTTKHWTSKDLEALPQKEGTRYEIIDGETLRVYHALVAPPVYL